MLKTMLTDSWLFFRYHWVALAMIILPIVISIDILGALYRYGAATEATPIRGQILPILIDFAAYPIYSIAIVFYLASAVAGDTLEIKTLWRMGLRYWLPFATLILLVGLAVVFGFLLLVVPGIIFTLRFAFAEFELLLHQRGPLAAMRRSWHRTGDHVGLIFGGYAVISLVLFVPYFSFTVLLDQASAVFGVADTAAGLGFAVFNALYTIFAFRVYEFAESRPDTATGPSSC